MNINRDLKLSFYCNSILFFLGGGGGGSGRREIETMASED